MVKKTLLLWSGAGLLLGLQACSGGGGGSDDDTSLLDVEGLAGPDSVSIVAATDDSVGSGAGIAPGANIYPAGSDYNTDRARTWVYDPSMESLDQVNSILCYMDNTAYDEMVNLGAYQAQLNKDLCENGENEGSEGSESGQSSASKSEEFEFFTVVSERASNSASQVASIWVPQNDREGDGGPGDDGDMTIYVELEVDEAATDDNPTGDFSMSWAGALSYDEISAAEFRGGIRSVETEGDIGYQYFDASGDVTVAHEEGEYSREVAMTVSMDEAQENGSARIRIRERYNFGAFGGGDSGLMTTEWRVAFNDTHFKRQADDETPITLSRDTFDTTVWRYQLYYADGDEIGNRVELQSGFPFTTETGDFGWAGYYGIWAPEHVDLSDGDTVYREEFGQEGLGDAYTVVQAPGRLIKSERNQIDLTELSGQSLQYWDWETGYQYMVGYEAGDFYRIAQFDEETFEWSEIDPPVLIDPDLYGGFLGFWSDSLGGPVNWVDGDDYVTFFKESFVNGSDAIFDDVVDGALPLFGYFECLDAELTGSAVESGQIYLEESFDVESPHRYVFDADDLTLYLDEEGNSSNLRVVGLADGQEPNGGPYHWGMRSGPLVADTSSLVEVHDLWDLDVYYTYETGHNLWNKLTTLRDSTDEYVTFDAPLQFLYTHSTANDRNDSADYDGQSFFLEYHGSGDLGGIPWVRGDFEGAGDDFERWFPAFSIADGVVMGPEGTEYVVRALEMEQTLAQDESGSAGLSLTGATELTLPDSSMVSTPRIGEKPTITDPPAVINGEVQGD